MYTTHLDAKTTTNKMHSSGEGEGREYKSGGRTCSRRPEGVRWYLLVQAKVGLSLSLDIIVIVISSSNKL